MSLIYLHQHPEFDALVRIVSQEKSIAPILVEKDYWIMHCLHGLQENGMTFQLKGGTSLSKGHGLIHRFSEDVDILIEPPAGMAVYTGKNQDKPNHRESRRLYYEWLAQNIHIEGIIEVNRDISFDDEKYRSGGIRLIYQNLHRIPKDIKDGILLEVGFDNIAPNSPKTISSWAYDFAVTKAKIKDNRAQNILCYHPGYTLVEKLQTISTKFRKQQASGKFSENFLRHYYDVFCLLQTPDLQSFIGTEEYYQHKIKRFRGEDEINIAANEAFVLSDAKTRALYEKEYSLSQSLYYKEKPKFTDILDLINHYKEKL